MQNALPDSIGVVWNLQRASDSMLELWNQNLHFNSTPRNCVRQDLKVLF